MAEAPAFPPPGTLKAKLFNQIGNVHGLLYRLSGGRIGGTMAKVPVLVLDHVGRKSGKARRATLYYLEDGRNLVIVASRGGSDEPPAWSLNLFANPRTTVQIGSEKRNVVARRASEEEKAALWPRLVDLYAEYEVYQQRTARQIPVILLEPAT